MASADPPTVDHDDVLSVIAKLQGLRDGLPPAEQAFMDGLFEYFVTKFSEEPRVQDLISRLPDGESLLDDVSGFIMEPPVLDGLIPLTYTDTLCDVSVTCLCPPTPPII